MQGGLNLWARWLQTPLLSAASSSPLIKGRIPPKAGSWEALQAAQCGGSILEGFPLGFFKVYDQVTTTVVSEDTGLAGLGISLGFALATLLILEEKVSGKGAALPGHRQQKVAFPVKQARLAAFNLPA